MKRGLLAALAVALLAANLILPDYYEANMVEKRANESAMLDILGESRTVIARALWFKMNLYHEMHEDRQTADDVNQEMPLMRLVSLLDPSFVDAFENIAWDLWKGHNQADQALGILDEGLAQNPGQARLLILKALILISKKRYHDAATAGHEALRRATDEFDRLDAGRVALRAYQELGDKTGQRQVLIQLLEVRPDDPHWLRLLHDLN
ncbi:MAG: hypothetical protein KC910_17255 [Candidatus Eremiobacteraeota bacterium]|nr:hypothetical protein [Candidatus Eremiobacteraeota bacterium]